mmetsp:Transcript_15601/g.20340  ORF Transcript_15601/g.20340 Transcript_15601/m.20340 type:complete len:668 (-) Transcript_15601:3085-5088(-)
MSPQQEATGLIEIGSKSEKNENNVKGIELRWLRISKTVEVRDITTGLMRASISNSSGNKESGEKNVASNSVKRRILNRMSGSAKPGEILAIMGPSGSGKTSLLDVLSGRSTFDSEGLEGNSFSGITINGVNATASSMKWLKRKIAYVKQRDIFFNHLTVRDQLTYTAMLRLPKDSTDHHEEVERIIASLKLTKCADSPILMISGGERKRVNIGTELLTNPNIVMLDEPTSGLDSTSAVALMKMLKDLAWAKKKTVITSIHQPSSSVFASFTKVMLLADGNVVYYGNPRDSLQYLDNIGMPCPSGYNAAEHWMDLLVVDSACEQDQKSDGDEESAFKTKREKLLEAWNHEKLALDMEKLDSEILANRSEFGHEDFLDEDTDDSKYGSTWSTQLLVLTHRCMKNGRSAVFTKMNLLKSALIGIVIGLVWFQMDYTERTVNDRSAYFFFTMTFWVFDAMFQSFMAFPFEREIIFKERASGTYHMSSYFIAKTLSEAPVRLTLPLLYMVFSYWLAGLNKSIGIFLGTTGCTLLSVFAGESIGLLLGASIFDFEKAMVVLAVLGLGLMAVGGFFVENIPSFMVWVEFISPFKYAFDASQQLTFDRDVPCDGSAVLEEYCGGRSTGYATVDDIHEFLGIQGSVAFNAGMLLVFSIFCRCGAFIALKVCYLTSF